MCCPVPARDRLTPLWKRWQHSNGVIVYKFEAMTKQSDQKKTPARTLHPNRRNGCRCLPMRPAGTQPLRSAAGASGGCATAAAAAMTRPSFCVSVPSNAPQMHNSFEMFLFSVSAVGRSGLVGAALGRRRFVWVRACVCAAVMAVGRDPAPLRAYAYMLSPRFDICGLNAARR